MSKKNKDIAPYNDKGQPHGYWEWYYYNGDLMCKRFYQNGKRVGYGEVYNFYNCKLLEKKYYI